MKRPVLLAAFILVCMLLVSGFFHFNSDSDKKSVIKFSSWGSKSEIDILQNLISDFETANPDIKVEFIHIPQNYFQKIQLLFASGLEPDVIFLNNQNILMYINAGLLEDLTPYFSGELNNFYAETLNCFKKDNKLYAIPRDISNLVIYYNKDIFKSQKTVMPSKIQTIFELKKLAKDVTTKNNWGINYEENPVYWLYYLASNGGGILSDDGRTIIINKEENIQALNLYSDMIHKDNSVPSKAQMGSMTSAQMFINGKLAMYLSGRWMTPKFRETINFNWDVVEFPAKHKLYIDSSGWAIAKHSKHKQEAVRFIKYMSTKEAESEIANTGLIIPANINAKFQENSQLPKNFIIFKTMLVNAKPTPINENYSAILDNINEKIENIFNGKSRAEEIFTKEEVQKLNKIIE